MTSNNDSKTTAAADVSPSSSYLRQDQLETFLRDGILVVENVLSPNELVNAKCGLQTCLKQNHHIDTDRLRETGHYLSNLSSTNGSGGVLDIFYESWKLDIAVHPKLFAITTELWKVAYDNNNKEQQSSLSSSFKWQPYGAFDYTKGYMYLDRIGYRLPTILAEELGNVVVSNNGQRNNNNNNKKKKKTIPIQRSLTPHLDCCPETYYDIPSKAGQKQKWRPIQCFVSLSDTTEPQNGGFEAVRGFHHDFAEWAAHRPPTTVTSKKTDSAGTTTRTKNIIIPAPCIGEYTHIRPKEDKEIMDRIEHIPVSAGSAVFWDNRIPHANSYRHLGTSPRAVVYCSFLPDVPVNRRYVARQLQAWKDGRHPTDQWINPTKTTTDSDTDNNGEKRRKDAALACLEKVATTPLARHLVGLDPWEG